VTFAMLLLFGPLPAALGSMVGGVAITFVTHAKDLREGRTRGSSLARRALFNMAALGLSVLAAGGVYLGVRGLTGTVDVLSNLLPLSLAAVTSEFANAALVVLAVALQTHKSPWEIWKDNVSWAVPMNIVTMILGGAGLALGYQTAGILGVAVYSLPLVLTIYAFRLYVTKSKAHLSDLRENIKEREEAESRLVASLAEKEILLKEIHHRVKNNLQVISSLLSLQSQSLEDEPTVRMFQESQHRIRSMALVHEELYQSGDLRRIEFSHYVRNLANYLFRSYGVNVDGVKLAIDVSDLHLGIDAAVPCGLIINELMSNALKHAFTDGRHGRIHIQLRANGDGQCRLVVADNGIGLPEGFDIRRSETLGLRLVSTLVEQLGGTIHLDRSDGTEFAIAFDQTDHVFEVPR
jgi:two-component sensor histidine kinase